MKVTIEFDQEDYNVAMSIMSDLVLLTKNYDEYLNYEDSLQHDTPHPHFTTVGESLILDKALLEAWEASTYMNLEDMINILQVTGVIDNNSCKHIGNNGIKFPRSAVSKIRRKMAIQRNLDFD